MALPAMFQSHNPLDVDMAALKKGEIDLGTSMYIPSSVHCRSSLIHQYGCQVQGRSDTRSRQSNDNGYDFVSEN